MELRHQKYALAFNAPCIQIVQILSMTNSRTRRPRFSRESILYHFKGMNESIGCGGVRGVFGVKLLDYLTSFLFAFCGY